MSGGSGTRPLSVLACLRCGPAGLPAGCTSGPWSRASRSTRGRRMAPLGRHRLPAACRSTRAGPDLKFSRAIQALGPHTAPLGMVRAARQAVCRRGWRVEAWVEACVVCEGPDHSMAQRSTAQQLSMRQASQLAEPPALAPCCPPPQRFYRWSAGANFPRSYDKSIFIAQVCLPTWVATPPSYLGLLFSIQAYHASPPATFNPPHGLPGATHVLCSTAAGTAGSPSAPGAW